MPVQGKTPEPAAEPAEGHGASLDRYDIAILRELQQDARLSNAELASRSRRLARALAGLGVGLGARAVQIANGGRHFAEGDRQELTPA